MIRVCVILACLIGAALGASPSAAAASPHVAECHPRALVTSDNDIRVEADRRPKGRPVDMPPAVLAALRNIASELIAELDAELASDLTCRSIFPAVYRISAAERRDLFVAEISLSLAGR